MKNRNLMFTYILTGFSKIIRVNLLNKYEDSKKVHLKFVQSAQKGVLLLCLTDF